MRRDTTLEVIHGPETTIAVLDVTGFNGIGGRFVGDAKKHPRDVADESIGEAYAIGRALDKAAKHFLAIADSKVLVSGFGTISWGDPIEVNIQLIKPFSGSSSGQYQSGGE